MTGLIVAMVVVVWLVSGLALAVVMRRRGHDMLPWLVPGLVFGPLLIPYAFDQLKRERFARDRVLTPDPAATGTVDVLVGIDGSPESRAATRAALQLLGPRVGRVTLATVIDFETAMPDTDLLLDPGWHDVRERLAGELADLAASIAATAGLPGVGTVLLAGRPATALAHHAEEHACELLVVGPRGKGLARAVLGSVATELARGAKVPVLIAGH